ncbi:MAG: STAS domain-containing protein [Sterolibacteriaceae bacterium]|jgi:anti-anti-sigma factor|uniref:Anti-sigma factor antagonist n=1 Tax=Candidatus Methylophosphatis roskildensis TaxID=2899263 RepID=A0A9D7HQM5_9PROT|nr:STAS domain-containing protein [Candidatus Methylophosphatis roskildensis]MBK7235914.1 STAS domain-containing protein [Sterolibacteriaceae bacterium]
MCANVVTRDNCAVIQLHGRFDFNAHRDVRGAVDRALSIPGAESVTVEMKRVDYLDSSALGMLLLVRDKARGANRNVALSRVNGSVRQVLDIANFGRLFAIS